MTPRSLFQIIIKIFGLFFVLSIVNAIPQLLSTIWYYVNPQNDGVDNTWLLGIGAILGLGFQFFFAYLFLFNSNVLVDKLKLDQYFEDDIFNFKIPKSFVFLTAIIVVVGIILIQEIPNLVLDIYLFFQSTDSNYNSNDFSFTASIISIAKVVLALLLIGERKFVVRLIDKDAFEAETKGLDDTNEKEE